MYLRNRTNIYDVFESVKTKRRNSNQTTDDEETGDYTEKERKPGDLERLDIEEDIERE